MRKASDFEFEEGTRRIVRWLKNGHCVTVAEQVESREVGRLLMRALRFYLKNAPRRP